MSRIPFARISRSWGLRKKLRLVEDTNNRAFIVRSDVGLYVLKRDYSKEKTAEELRRLSSFLLDRGFNVPVAIFTPDGRPDVKIGKHMYSLFSYLEGEKADKSLSNANPEMAFEFGSFTGKFHLCLETASAVTLPRSNLLRTLSSSVRVLFSKAKSMSCFDRDTLESFFSDFYSIYYCLPVQIVHGDFHPGNIIIKEGRVSGVIDFEYAAREVKVLDIAYLVASVLTEFHRMGAPSLALYLIPYFLDGYCQSNTLSVEERKSIVYILASILLNQLYVFTVDGKRDEAVFVESILKWVIDSKARIMERTVLTYLQSKEHLDLLPASPHH